MKQPPGFVDSSLPSHVCRLHKSLYGLKQAPRAWYTRLSDFLLSIDFRASKVDTSLFILSDGTNIFYLLVYVDDILFTGSNSAMLHHLIQLLSSEFKLRDLGVIHYFLGIEVQSTGMGLMLLQHKYILPANPLILQSPLRKSLYYRITHSLILRDFAKSWVLFNILPSPIQIYALLLTESVSLCMLLQILIGPLLSVFYVILKVRHLMVFISLEDPLLLYMALQMQIGLVVLMITSLRLAILSFLIRRRFLGNPASNAQLLAPLLRLSIKLLLMVPLKSFGFNTC